MTPERDPSAGAPPEAQTTSEQQTVQQVRRKAERMRRARKPSPSVLRYLAQVGALGWLFILPVVGIAALGRWLGRTLGQPSLALLGVFVGLAVGAVLFWRSVQRSLREDDWHEHDDEH